MVSSSNVAARPDRAFLSRHRDVDPAVRLAREILERAFRDSALCFRARLWDGSELALGRRGEEAPFTLVFGDRDTFRRIFLRGDTLAFGEAFADGGFDVDGDLYAALGLANEIDRLRLDLGERLAILARLLRI